jgi:hypothetical protein
MSRFSGMSPRGKRAWGVGLIIFFIVLIGMIAFSEWWAYNVNVPQYQRSNSSAPHK